MLDCHAKLGDYLLTRKLGTGQYSKVREAFKEADPKKYAAKYMIKTPDLALNKTFLDLVHTEATTMSQLLHPNVVRLYEYNDKGVMIKKSGKERPVIYLVFDLITGGELFDYVAVSGRFSDKLARHYFRQLIDALEFVHGKGFAHRDIKAENVLLGDNYELKLADFGFSAPRTGKDGSGKHTTYKGTLGYMAPEIHAGQAYVGEKVDLFAVGVLLFIMVAQHPPFRKAVAQDGFYKMFCQQNEMFWAKVGNGKPPGTFSPTLKALLNSLLAFNSALRPSIAEIKSHPWYNGPLMTPEEIKTEFAARRAKVELEWKAKAAEALAKKKPKAGGFCPHPVTKSSKSEQETAIKSLPIYKPSVFTQTVMFSVEEASDIIKKMEQYFTEQLCEFKVCDKKYKISGKYTTFEEDTAINVRIEKADEGVNCIKIEKVAGDKMEFLGIFNEIRDMLTEAKMILA